MLEMSPYTFTDLQEEQGYEPLPEAPQEENSSPANPDPEEMNSEPQGDSDGLEPQNDLPEKG